MTKSTKLNSSKFYVKNKLRFVFSYLTKKIKFTTYMPKKKKYLPKTKNEETNEYKN